MIEITTPKIEKLIYSKDKNFIKQYYKQSSEIKYFEYIQNNPFILSSDEKLYFITSNLNDVIPENCTYAILTSRRPTKRDFESGSLKIMRWLKHPSFEELTPQDVLNSWKNKFKFVKEDIENNINGLRPPQIGALYSILAHVQNSEERGIVVMPTGTGKTETMLSTLVANECNKLLVAVPSDSLRTQLSNKFFTLGLLREFGMVDETCHNPIVGVINQKFEKETIKLLKENKCISICSDIELKEVSIKYEVKSKNKLKNFFKLSDKNEIIISENEKKD